MEETWGVVLVSLAMFVGCYLAGSIPLSITLSESKTRIVSILGAGLLVGTALAVIIPEGIHSLFEAAEDYHKEHNEAGPKQEDEQGGEHKHHNVVEELHSLIGVALVLGFVFMLIVDQCSGGGGHSHGPSIGDSEVQQRIQKNRITATIGLVVHAAADGIAMGSAASGSRADIQMIVFVAIMLHKAPAAFGLVTFLMYENYQRFRIRKHLLAFSLSAPVATMVTYFGLSHASKQTLSTVNATGVSMLFSAGTFLYVATVHVLPELVGRQHTPQTAEGDNNAEVRTGFTWCELLAIVCGCIAPLFLAIGHHH